MEFDSLMWKRICKKQGLYVKELEAYQTPQKFKLKTGKTLTNERK